MEAWLGQYCIYVSDLGQTTKFYETAGLTCTSQTDIPNVKEAILENANGRGGKIQLAQKLDVLDPDSYRVEIITLARDRRS